MGEYNWNVDDILAFLNDPACDHPGCHELYGSDDAMEEVRGTYMEGKLSRLVEDCISKADTDPRPAYKLALLDLGEAAIRGEGARDAFRKLRVASNHSLPEHI